MGAAIDEAIADAGPLIHLREIGALHFLRLLEALHIPDAVWAETVGQGRVSDAELVQLGNVKRHSFGVERIAAFVEEQDLTHLHTGERACLYLLQQQDTSLVLTDDLAVRDVVKGLGGTPVGSLGVIVRAYWVGKITLEEAEHLLYALHRNSTLFVTETIVELAVEQLRRRL